MLRAENISINFGWIQGRIEMEGSPAEIAEAAGSLYLRSDQPERRPMKGAPQP
jgi:hypothetical protein